jgi:hypothetical protein
LLLSLNRSSDTGKQITAGILSLLREADFDHRAVVALGGVLDYGRASSSVEIVHSLSQALDLMPQSLVENHIQTPTGSSVE